MRFSSVMALAALLGCTASHSYDGYSVIKVPVGDRELSCKGLNCCYPWKDKGVSVSVCLKPMEGSDLGVSGAVLIIRGRFP